MIKNPASFSLHAKLCSARLRAPSACPAPRVHARPFLHFTFYILHLKARLRRAFTSIELLFVIVLISLLIGLLVPGVKALHRDAQKRRAQTDLQTLAQALRNYQLAYGHLGPFTNTTASAASTDTPKPFPLNVSALRPGHSENHRDILFITTPSRSSRYTDPWGNSYHILFGRDNADEISGFTLSSPGPDKTPGTSDDISLHSY